MSKIYSDFHANQLLGCLLQDVQLANSDKYKLDKNDFAEQIHKILYATLHNLSKRGYKVATYADIETFLQPYEAQLNVFNEVGESYIDTIIELAELDNFEGYYDTIRKMSLLREYRDKGFSIFEFWDETKTDEDNQSNIDKFKITDIIKHYQILQNSIDTKFNSDIQVKEMICGDGFDELLDELQENPLVGAGLCSGMLNELYRGWCKQHLILRGAPSSFGKTLFGLSDALNVSSLKIWDDINKKFIDNPYYQGMGVYIHSEQNPKYDIQTRAIATLARVSYGDLRNGTFTKDEKKRLSEAGRILKESKFKIIYYPDFTGSGLRRICEKLRTEGYEYVTKDYIWNNSYIISDIKEKTGLNNISEPNGLMMYSNEMKSIAEDCDMAMSTMMQLNGKQDEALIVDDGCLYASRAVKTKLDNGSIMMNPRKKELSTVEPFIMKWNKDHNKEAFGNGSIIYPNAVSHCFKTRYGGHGENIMIFHLVDKSIGTITDMFATNWDCTPLKDTKTQKIYNLKPLYIERK